MTRRQPWKHRFPDAVKVDRTTKWGNPFDVKELGRARAIGMYRAALLAGELPVSVDDVRRELVGKDLACWCQIQDRHGNRVSCHADVLLEIANGEDVR